MLTQKDGHKAWGAYLDTILREPTDAELAQLTPEIPEEDRDKLTIGQLEEMTKQRWFENQKQDMVWLLIKEVNYARRNEHHVLAKIFGKDIMEKLTDEQKEALHKRFDELNIAVKGKPE